MFEARVQAEAFDLATEQARLAGRDPGIGALVSFLGQVRDHPLTIEHWPGVAERRMAALLDAARSRWPLLGALAIHRFGTLGVGEPIVLVLTASSHRSAAFEAAQYLMDWLKTDAPFWKKAPDGWVEARDADAVAASRWQEI